MRLIDADDLLEQRVYTVAKGKGFPYREAYKNMLYDIEQAPTVEAEPIRHGRWELREGFNHLVKCSVCGHEYIDYIECDNFCGNCGAKMDEEVEI